MGSKNKRSLMYSQIVSGSYMYISSCEWEYKINLQHVHVYVFWDNLLCNLYFYIKNLEEMAIWSWLEPQNIDVVYTFKYINDYQVYRLKQIIFLFWNYFFLLELKIELLCYLWCFKACRTIFCNYWQFILQWKKNYYSIHITV